MSVILIKLELQMVLLLSIMYGVEYVTLWARTFGGIALTSDVRFVTKTMLPFTIQLDLHANGVVMLTILQLNVTLLKDCSVKKALKEHASDVDDLAT